MDLFYEEMMKVVDVLEGKKWTTSGKASEVCADTILKAASCMSSVLVIPWASGWN